MISCEYLDEPYITKIRVSGLPEDEDRIVLCSFVLTQYRRVTDGQTDKITVAKTAISLAVRCKNGW